LGKIPNAQGEGRKDVKITAKLKDVQIFPECDDTQEAHYWLHRVHQFDNEAILVVGLDFKTMLYDQGMKRNCAVKYIGIEEDTNAVGQQGDENNRLGKGNGLQVRKKKKTPNQHSLAQLNALPKRRHRGRHNLVHTPGKVQGGKPAVAKEADRRVCKA
jgi:hypothetical protein